MLGPTTGELSGLIDRKYSDLSEDKFHYIFPYLNRIGFDLCRCRKFYQINSRSLFQNQYILYWKKNDYTFDKSKR